jgi:hypothetical protein
MEWWKNGLFTHYSNIPSFLYLKKFPDPFPHPMGDLAEDISLANFKPTLCLIFTSIEDETYSGRIHRTVDNIDEAPDPNRRPSPNR